MEVSEWCGFAFGLDLRLDWAGFTLELMDEVEIGFLGDVFCGLRSVSHSMQIFKGFPTIPTSSKTVQQFSRYSQNTLPLPQIWISWQLHK